MHLQSASPKDEFILADIEGLNPEFLFVTKVPKQFIPLLYFCIVKTFLIKYKLTWLGMILGAVGGYLYYYFWGCNSETCSITSSPLNSTVYGTIMGALLLNFFEPSKKSS